MCPISNKTGPDSSGETSWEDRSFNYTSAGQNNNKELIYRANSVLLSQIFSHYGLHADANNHKIICPFPAHKGGRETTASFYYYPHTNSFNCFGCGVGGSCCDFVANKENISKDKAAIKILSLFSDDVVADGEVVQINFSERLEIMLDFSATVREFRQEHFDEKSTDFIEHICWVYDAMNDKHKNKLDNDALRRMVQNLKKKIKFYIPCKL